MSKADFVEQYYERIAADPAYRARLLADPVAVVSEQFGYAPGPDLKIEIIEQVADTVVIMVPPKPEPGQDIEQELTRVTEQVFDLLFSTGIGGFFCPTAYGTELANGKETREINGKHYVLEYPIYGDVALVKAERGDRWGNLTYRMSARNFGPVCAMAAKHTVATVHELVELGEMDPEAVVTPGIFVSRVVKVPRVATQAGGFKK